MPLMEGIGIGMGIGMGTEEEAEAEAGTWIRTGLDWVKGWGAAKLHKCVKGVREAKERWQNSWFSARLEEIYIGRKNIFISNQKVNI